MCGMRALQGWAAVRAALPQRGESGCLFCAHLEVPGRGGGLPALPHQLHPLVSTHRGQVCVGGGSCGLLTHPVFYQVHHPG